MNKSLIKGILLSGSTATLALMLSSLTQADSNTVMGSDQLTPPKVSPNSILTMDSGVEPQAGSSNPNTFTTNKSCPDKFQPYVTINSYSIASAGSDTVPGSAGACVQSVSNGSKNYTVTYLAAINYGTIKQSANAGLYVNTNDYSWTVWNTTALPPSSEVSNTDSNKAYTITNISWTLFCYPENINPPSYSSNCQVGTSPY